MRGFFPIFFAPGFFTSSQVVNALWVGTFVAAVSGMIGVFVVIRGQSFVGHALTDLGATGASGAFLIGLNIWYGFLSFGLLAGAGVELMGDKNHRSRDIATGIILSFAMGLGALFLYFDTITSNNATVSMLVLFGSIFVMDPTMTPIVIGVGLATIVLLGVLYRPLILSSVNPEIARTRGVPVRLVGLIFMILLAAAVEDGALVLGALLSTALLIGPAAAAVRLTSRTGLALIWAAGMGILATWLGIILAYDSYEWPPYGRGWPVSFFTAVLILVFYLVSHFISKRSRWLLIREVNEK
ncbi:metal ABC transporter permease [Shimazuella sp. AN120528]|uniref:metal ABC transporter permease n=1 Tax=Shimazuella soli TaxID=1892854 RepID=UPI001F11777B|nr:metal ABC transporter permease [Shimazuella soli]